MRKKIFVLAFALFVLIAPSAEAVVFSVEPTNDVERTGWFAFLAKHGKTPILEYPRLDDVYFKIAAANPNIPRPKLIQVLDTKEDNAYHYAGGYIFLTRASLEKAPYFFFTDADAWAIAHELAHFKLKHSTSGKYGLTKEREADEEAFRLIANTPELNPAAGVAATMKMRDDEEGTPPIEEDPLSRHPDGTYRLARQTRLLYEYSFNSVLIVKDEIYLNGKFLSSPGPSETKGVSVWGTGLFNTPSYVNLCVQAGNLAKLARQGKLSSATLDSHREGNYYIATIEGLPVGHVFSTSFKDLLPFYERFWIATGRDVKEEYQKLAADIKAKVQQLRQQKNQG